ncbi:MAG TPA: sigma-70 family RNA polymerase sigma factor [Ruminococcaceae bacterium]|nr:sigma-70 family RNA polymerase sigma factor [Oscillospiraceae bacterium]
MTNNKQRYLEINGEQVAVTEEVYFAYKRPVWAEHKQQERAGRCRDENGRRCMKNCRLCNGDRDGRPVSLEKINEDGYEVPEPVYISQLVENKLLLEALYGTINKFEPENRQIIMLFSAGFSEREIAARVGLSQKCVNNRKNKLFAQLKKELEHFR